MNRGWIGVDLDGCLATYDHWRGIEHIGEPVPLMLERVREWLRKGTEVRIFTARVDGGEVALLAGDPNGHAHRDVAAVRAHIEAWCLKHLGVVLPVTNVKDYGMRVLYDDRAIQVEVNTGRLVSDRSRAVDLLWQDFDGLYWVWDGIAGESFSSLASAASYLLSITREGVSS